MIKTSKSKTATAPDPGTSKADAPKVTVPAVFSTGDNEKPTELVKSADPATAHAPKPPSKADQLAALVVRDEGATLDQMVAALGWLPHTTRAALTGLKKKGFVLSSDKVDGARTYRAVAPE